jgi:Ca-activated chloride channel homolog
MLSTVGVGEDFNEYLMTALADAGTGNYYYLRGAEDLSTVFAGEFNGARHTVASGLAVRIEPAPGVRVEDVAGYPLERDGGAVVVRPGALFAGQERRLWVTLAVPHDAAGDRDLGRFALSYDDGKGRVTRTFAETPRVACVRGEAEFYAGVDVPAWTRSVVDEAYQAMQSEVAREVKAGRRDEALSRLRQFKDEASAMNERVQAPAVAAQLGAVDKLEQDVTAAFEGEDQRAKQNAFSKTKSAESVDSRRIGAKK